MAAALSVKASGPEQNRSAPADAPPFHFRQETSPESSGWDAAIAGLAGRSVFHSSAWARVLAGTYGFTPVYTSAWREAGIITAMPLMEVKSWLTGTRGIALPFTDECAFVGDARQHPELVAECVRIGRRRGWKSIEFRGGEKIFGQEAPSITFLGHELHLGDPDAVFNGFESSVRRAIRKAEKSGLKIEFSEGIEAMAGYYSLHCKTRRRHGLPPQPFGFFHRIQEEILNHKMGTIATAKMNGRAIASAVFFFDESEALYKFGASDEAEQQLRANNLVMWEAIKWLMGKGVKVLRFGRTSSGNEGLRRYKLGWGTKEYPIHYFKYDLRRDSVIPLNDDSEGWHNAVFRAAPGFMNRWAGVFLYKHIA